MSDGPHRSLPLRPHWKKLAEWAAKPAFSLDDVATVLTVALKQDFSEKVLKRVRGILSGLFAEDCRDQLEAARSYCRGSVVDNLFIDCAIEANSSGLTGDMACNTALENAFGGYLRNINRQIVEHYLRKAPNSAVNLRDRLTAARGHSSVTTLATEMLSEKGNTGSGHSLPKHTGIDEGPPL
jgi:hypothetical protein